METENSTKRKESITPWTKYVIQNNEHGNKLGNTLPSQKE